jgi:hypothetical protein
MEDIQGEVEDAFVEKLVDTLLDRGVDFAVIEEALDALEMDEPDNG